MNAAPSYNEIAWEVRESELIYITRQMKTVLDYLDLKGEMTDEDMQELLGIKKTRAYILARDMKDRGLLEIYGRGTAKRYRKH